VRAALQAAQAGLAASAQALGPAPGLRLEPPENLHLTLVFLGESEEGALARLGARAAATCARHGPLSLSLGPTGAFGAPEPWVLWVGVQGALDRLGALQEALSGDAAAEGWARDARLFTPHLTAARVRAAQGVAGGAGLGATWAAQPVAPAAMTLTEVTLFQSVGRQGGMVYRPLRSWPLAAV
jgi:2'-5' RNA ligase